MPTTPTSIRTAVGASGESTHPDCAIAGEATARMQAISIRRFNITFTEYLSLARIGFNADGHPSVPTAPRRMA